MAILFNFIPNHLFVDSGIAVCDAYCIIFKKRTCQVARALSIKIIKCTLGQASWYEAGTFRLISSFNSSSFNSNVYLKQNLCPISCGRQITNKAYLGNFSPPSSLDGTSC